MTLTKCPYCHKPLTTGAQQTLCTPLAQQNCTGKIFWEDSETRSGRLCKKAFLTKNSDKSWPIPAYLELKRQIEMLLAQDDKAVIDGDFYFLGNGYIGKMESSY